MRFFIARRLAKPDDQSLGHGEAKMIHKPIQVAHILKIDSDDYRDVPGYREYVKDFIKWDSLKGPVFVQVGDQQPVPVTTIDAVDKLVK